MSASKENSVTDQCLVNVLWTGGWDSTFRMIQLSRDGATVQPYYILDTNRQSALIEIKTINKIRNELMEKYRNCEIKNLKIFELSTIDINKEIKEAHQRLVEESYMGAQYIWIAALAEKVDGLELSIHKDDKAEYFTRKLSGDENFLSDEKIIFGNLQFPILDYTKLEMEKEAELSGDVNILYKTWFCFTPINGTSCGVCPPCRYSIEEGMSKRFTKRAKLYNKFPKTYFRVRKQINRIIN